MSPEKEVAATGYGDIEYRVARYIALIEAGHRQGVDAVGSGVMGPVRFYPVPVRQDSAAGKNHVLKFPGGLTDNDEVVSVYPVIDVNKGH